MMVPPEITFRNMESSTEVESDVREHIAKLEDIYGRITSCKVVIEAPHKQLPTSEPFHAKIYLAIPNHDIIVDHDPGDRMAHQRDVHTAVHDSFDAAERQIKEIVDKMRGYTKSHEPPPHGVVKTLFPDQDYGFIETPDHREIYFHSNSVTDTDCEKFEVVQQVRYQEVEGDKGPQATVVQPVGRHHHFEDQESEL